MTKIFWRFGSNPLRLDFERNSTNLSQSIWLSALGCKFRNYLAFSSVYLIASLMLGKFKLDFHFSSHSFDRNSESWWCLDVLISMSTSFSSSKFSGYSFLMSSSAVSLTVSIKLKTSQYLIKVTRNSSLPSSW